MTIAPVPSSSRSGTSTRSSRKGVFKSIRISWERPMISLAMSNCSEAIWKSVIGRVGSLMVREGIKGPPVDKQDRGSPE